MSDKPSFSEMMKAAQKLKENMEKTQQELEKQTVEAETGAGITVKVNGLKKVQSIKINPELFTDGDETLEEKIEIVETLLVGAMNEAMDKVEKTTEKKVVDIAKGFKLSDIMPSKPSSDDTEENEEK